MIARGMFGATAMLALLFAVACSDDGGGSSTTSFNNACGPATPGIACEGNQVPSGNSQPTIAVTLTPVAPANAAIFDGVPSDGLALGDPNAPVTIDLYTNFICGNCAAFALETLPPLVTEHVAAGNARIVFHHAPLGGAPAIRAHQASQCAADQGRFWPAFAQIYANFSQQSAAYDNDRLSTMMANAGLDVSQFEACIEEGSHRDDIEAAIVAFSDLQAGAGAGFAAATATSQGRQLLPVVIINGRAIVSPTLDEMRAIIAEELA
jgi:protein-disulfide isomerase